MEKELKNRKIFIFSILGSYLISFNALADTDNLLRLREDGDPYSSVAKQTGVICDLCNPYYY